MSTYREKLQHPKWQEKRLRILDRAGFSCEDCGAREKTLHVHHGYYRPGADPWDYEDATLHALCEDCHELWQAHTAMLHQQAGHLRESQLAEVIGFIVGLRLQADSSYSLKQPDDIGALFEYMAGIAAAWRLRPEVVIDASYEGDLTGAVLAALRSAGLQTSIDVVSTEAREPAGREET